MARKSSPSIPVVEIKQFGTSDEIQRAISKLKRRIEDVQRLDPQQIRWDDQAVKSVESGIQNAILEIYGINSPEYRDHKFYDIWAGPLRMGMSDYEMQRGFADGLPQAIKMLEGLITSLGEKLEDFESDSPARAYDTFQGLQFHPRIADVASQLFKDGHYTQAIFEASKALVRLIQDKSGVYNLDGEPLMNKVFSKDRPILAFPLEDPNDDEEQQGMMFLYKGFIKSIRNPKAHNNIIHKPTEHRALEYLAFISLLAERLNEAVLMQENR